MKSVAEYQAVSMEEAAVKSLGALKKWHRGRHLVAGQLWIPEETGRCRQEDDPLCKSGTAQGTHCQEESD
jgi:hypothetical protein